MKASDFIVAGKPGKLVLLNEDKEDSGQYLLVIAGDGRKVTKARMAYRAALLSHQAEIEEIAERADEDGKIKDVKDSIRQSELLEDRRNAEYEFAKELCVGSSFEDEDIDELIYENAFAIVGFAYDSERLKKN